MSQKTEEVKALEREGGRAMRHFLIFWFGLPLLLAIAGGALAGVLSRIAEGDQFEALGFGAVASLVTWWLARSLWRAVKK